MDSSKPADKLVLTEADRVPPPQPAVPEPPQASQSTPPGWDDPDYHALLEVKALAERVGGIQKLRELVDVVARLRQ